MGSEALARLDRRWGTAGRFASVCPGLRRSARVCRGEPHTRPARLPPCGRGGLGRVAVQLAGRDPQRFPAQVRQPLGGEGGLRARQPHQPGRAADPGAGELGVQPFGRGLGRRGMGDRAARGRPSGPRDSARPATRRQRLPDSGVRSRPSRPVSRCLQLGVQGLHQLHLAHSTQPLAAGVLRVPPQAGLVAELRVSPAGAPRPGPGATQLPHPHGSSARLPPAAYRSAGCRHAASRCAPQIVDSGPER